MLGMKRYKKFLIFDADIRNELCKFCYDWWEGSDKFPNAENWLKNCDAEDFPSYEEIENFLKRFVPKSLR